MIMGLRRITTVPRIWPPSNPHVTGSLGDIAGFGVPYGTVRRPGGCEDGKNSRPFTRTVIVNAEGPVIGLGFGGKLNDHMALLLKQKGSRPEGMGSPQGLS
jgi:hypothetical protein